MSIRRSALTWMGGPLPAPVPADIDDEVHEVVAGGSLRCRCGERHDTPPPSDFVIRMLAHLGTAELSRGVRGRAGSRTWIRGVAGRTEEQALARHLFSLWGHGLLGEDVAETLDALLVEPELNLVVFGGDPAHIRESAFAWLRARAVLGAARFCFIGDGHSLRSVTDVLTEAEKIATGALIAQLVTGDEAELSVLVGPDAAASRAPR